MTVGQHLQSTFPVLADKGHWACNTSALSTGTITSPDDITPPEERYLSDRWQKIIYP